MMRRVVLTWMLSVALMIGGCFDSGGGRSVAQAAAKTHTANRAPRISGTPPQSVVLDTRYEFRPTASDADRHALTFTIANKPGWAAFERATGRLSGIPRAGDVGTYANIRISVSDGRATTSLPAFGVSVTQSGSGSVTLSWMPPTENDDGTILRDLAGYRIYIGQSANALNRVIVLNNAGLTRYVIENLSPARWHFAMTSVNSGGRESQRSATVQQDRRLMQGRPRI